MNKKFAAVLAGIMAGTVVCGGESTLSALAAPAPEFKYGSSASGIISADESCPVEAEEVSVLLDIPQFPEADYGGDEQFCKYGARVVSQYTLHNPTESTVEVNLFFPFGAPPEYAVNYDENGKTVYGNASHYTVVADGKAVSPVLRHSYHGDYYYFDAEEEIKRLSDSPRDDAFFSDDLTVTVYTYSAGAAEGSADAADGFVSCFDYNRAKTRVLISENANIRIENGRSKVTVFQSDLNEDGKFSVFCLGVPPESAPEWRKKDGAGEKTAAELLSTKTTTFGQFAEESRPSELGVSETDWYNAVVDRLNEARTETCVLGSFDWLNRYDMLSLWYEYTLDIPADGRVSNAVSAPVYPDIEFSGRGNNRYPTFRYEYMFSAASRFADVGAFSVTVRTPYVLSNSTLDMQAREGEYYYQSQTLPHGALAFTLSDKDAADVSDGNPVNRSLIVALVILGVIVAGAIGLATAGYVMARKKKNK